MTPARETVRFGTLQIDFDERLLRPRAWTTAQSAWAAELLDDLPAGPVLELCAGAGHIGLLAIEARPRTLVAVDLNPAACAFIDVNATRANLRRYVDIREGAIEEVLAPHERFALVIADPPWVRHVEISRFPDDPPLAIDGGEDGLDIARICVRAAGAHLLPGGVAVLQLGGPAQVDALLPAFAQARLRVVERRDFPRGVLVRLDRLGHAHVEPGRGFVAGSPT